MTRRWNAMPTVAAYAAMSGEPAIMLQPTTVPRTPMYIGCARTDTAQRQPYSWEGPKAQEYPCQRRRSHARTTAEQSGLTRVQANPAVRFVCAIGHSAGLSTAARRRQWS